MRKIQFFSSTETGESQQKIWEGPETKTDKFGFQSCHLIRELSKNSYIQILGQLNLLGEFPRLDDGSNLTEGGVDANMGQKEGGIDVDEWKMVR